MSLEPAPDNLDDAEGTLGLLVHLVLWVVFHLPVPLDLVGVGARAVVGVEGGRRRGSGTLLLDHVRVDDIGGVRADGPLQWMRNTQARVLKGGETTLN